MSVPSTNNCGNYFAWKDPIRGGDELCYTCGGSPEAHGVNVALNAKLDAIKPPTLVNGKWFDWSNAAKICDTEIDSMIREAVESVIAQIKAGHFPAYGYSATGDTVVVASAYEGMDNINVEVLTPRLSQRIWYNKD